MVMVLVVVGVLVAIFASREREPEYGGKRLSEWVEKLVPPRASSQNPEVIEQKRRAEEAVLELRNRAVPFLLEWIRYKPSPARICCYNIANEVLGWLNASWNLADDQTARNAARAFGAVRALTIVAECPEDNIEDVGRLLAVPGLLPMLKNVDPAVRGIAVDVLRGVGAERLEGACP